MLSRLLKRRSDSADPEALLEKIDALTADDRSRPNVKTERRIMDLRHQAGLGLVDRGDGDPDYAEPAFDRLPGGSSVPEIDRDELTPELVRAAILERGCLLVRRLVDPDEALRLCDEVQRAYEARDAAESGESPNGGYYEVFEPDRRFDLNLERQWTSGGAGLWAADSPRVMVDMLDVLQRAGWQRLATGYLGERPAISVNKCVLRNVKPDIFKESSASAWHQDGAFMGDVRALNLWLTLSRCGDVAPGLDVVPRRTELVPTGTEGAAFDWSVSQAIAEEVAGESGIARPLFDPGDALLFDELLLHSTAADDAMTEPRYALESWFFGPSAFPDAYAPLAV